VAKAWNWVDSQNTSVYRKSFRPIVQRGGVESHSKYDREDSLPSLLPMVMLMAKGVPMLVELVLELHHGDSHTLGSQLSGRIPKGLKCDPVCVV
jgi:hypothetical protein